jgi:hypothetical protein
MAFLGASLRAWAPAPPNQLHMLIAGQRRVRTSERFGEVVNALLRVHKGKQSQIVIWERLVVAQR